MKNRWIILLLIVSTFGLSYAQEDLEESSEDPCIQQIDKKIEREFKRARELYRDGKKADALTIYEEILETDASLMEVNFYLGYTHYLTIERDNFRMDNHKREAEDAMTAFARINKICSFYRPIHNLYAAKIAYFSENFHTAIQYAKEVIDNPDLYKSLDEVDEAEIIYKKSLFYDKILNNPVPFNPMPVPGISTEKDEYLATISPDGEQFFFTRREDEKNSGTFGSSSVTKEYFCLSYRKGDFFSRGAPLPYPFNATTKEGSPTINLTNDLLVFTRMNKVMINGQSYPNYDLYYAEFDGQYWSEPYSLGKTVNRSDSWESNPSLSADGKLLLFASDREGGYGGSDIWYTIRNSDGTWRSPKNLGPTINTKGNERSPFIHTDSKTLYFSSDGHQGLGKMDIFYSRLDENGNWGTPVNIGTPINTEKSEVDFFVSFDGKTAYFSSNTGSSDDWNIYQFELYEDARPKNIIMIKGTVESNQEDLTDITVEIRDTTTNTVATTQVNIKTGKYALVAEVDPYNPKPLVVNIKKEGYAFDTHLVLTDPQKPSAIVETDGEIKKVEKGQSYNLNDIYFGTNLYSLSRDSKYLIDLFVLFLQENPNISIEIQGHTDDIGDAKANQELSEKRAKSVYDYLLSKGIPASRIEYNGYGEEMPIADNATESGRAKNRRTIFVIKEM